MLLCTSPRLLKVAVRPHSHVKRDWKDAGERALHVGGVLGLFVSFDKKHSLSKRGKIRSAS